jgi:hypothetical protein
VCSTAQTAISTTRSTKNSEFGEMMPDFHPQAISAKRDPLTIEKYYFAEIL